MQQTKDPRITQAERYRISHPRVPRDRRVFKSDDEMRSEGWEPAPLLTIFGAIVMCALCFGFPLALHFIYR